MPIYHVYFWLLVCLGNLVIAYRYYKLSQAEGKKANEIKTALPSGKFYISDGGFVTSGEAIEGIKGVVELGEFMLSSSKRNQLGFQLAGICAFLAAIAGFISIN